MVELFRTLGSIGLLTLLLGGVLYFIPRASSFGKEMSVVGGAITLFAVIVVTALRPTSADQKAQAALAEREGQKAQTASTEQEPEKVGSPTPKIPLMITSWKCTHSYGFMTIEGEVLNRSDHAIDNLLAVGSFKTGDDEFVKSATALVEYQPLLPGQRSPFKVMTTHNPEIKNCYLGFKEMFGGAVASEE